MLVKLGLVEQRYEAVLEVEGAVSVTDVAAGMASGDKRCTLGCGGTPGAGRGDGLGRVPL